MLYTTALRRYGCLYTHRVLCSLCVLYLCFVLTVYFSCGISFVQDLDVSVQLNCMCFCVFLCCWTHESCVRLCLCQSNSKYCTCSTYCSLYIYNTCSTTYTILNGHPLQGSAAAAEMLLDRTAAHDRKAVLNCVATDTGLTPLHVAAENGSPRLICSVYLTECWVCFTAMSQLLVYW